jgi:hypothetical protein
MIYKSFTIAIALASFTTRVLLRLVMVMTLSLLTGGLMKMVPDMPFITTAVQLILVMVTTLSLLMEAFSQAKIAVEACF